MTTIAAEAQRLFDKAEGIYKHCKSARAHDYAAGLYLDASDLLPSVQHPLNYLALVIRQQALLIEHVLPRLLTSDSPCGVIRGIMTSQFPQVDHELQTAFGDVPEDSTPWAYIDEPEVEYELDPIEPARRGDWRVVDAFLRCCP